MNSASAPLPSSDSSAATLVGDAPSHRSQHLNGFFDDNGLEVIARAECLDKLAHVSVARVAVTSGALPVVVPVNITLATIDPSRGPEVIMRSVEGSKLQAALRHAVIAIEADAIDPLSHAGWSVLVRGATRVIDDPDELDAARLLPLRPWAIPSADCYIAVGTEVVTGRQFVPWHPAPA